MSAAPAIFPPGMLPQGAVLLTVEAHEVERGDLLAGAGLTVPVDHLSFEGGRWWFFDHRGSVMAARRLGARVQVERGGLSSHDCDPAGIVRPLRLVQS